MNTDRAPTALGAARSACSTPAVCGYDVRLLVAGGPRRSWDRHGALEGSEPLHQRGLQPGHPGVQRGDRLVGGLPAVAAEHQDLVCPSPAGRRDRGELPGLRHPD
jgi:hypothetical protein